MRNFEVGEDYENTLEYISSTFKQIEEVTWIFEDMLSLEYFDLLTKLYPNINIILEFNHENIKRFKYGKVNFKIQSDSEMEILLINNETEGAMTVRTKELRIEAWMMECKKVGEYFVITASDSITFSKAQFEENTMNVGKFLPLSNFTIAIKNYDFYFPSSEFNDKSYLKPFYFFQDFSVEILLREIGKKE